MKDPACPDCNVVMERGFIPDVRRTGYDETYWMKGHFTMATSLGWGRGTGDVSMKVVTYRCPDCGLLREYAFSKKA